MEIVHGIKLSGFQCVSQMFLLVNEFNGNLDIISKPETEEELEEKKFLRINTD